MELNDKNFMLSYMLGIIIAILLCSMVSAYYSYITNKRIEEIHATLDEWELTK